VRLRLMIDDLPGQLTRVAAQNLERSLDAVKGSDGLVSVCSSRTFVPIAKQVPASVTKDLLAVLIQDSHGITTLLCIEPAR
jgi:hypothetical protein